MGALVDLVKVLYEPTAVFGRVREKPRFLAPFAAIAALQIVIGFLQLPYLRAAMASAYAQMAQQNPQAAATAQKFVWIGLVLAPIAIAFVLVIGAVLLWVLVSIVGGEGKFGTLLSVTTYAFSTGVLLQIVGLAVLMLKGAANVTSPEDLQPALGLDLLAPSAGRFATAVLKSFNPFSLWGVALTAIGIQTTHGTSRGAAYTAAGGAFVIGVLIAGAFALLRRG